MGSYAEWESGWPALSGVRPRSGKREMRERERESGMGPPLEGGPSAHGGLRGFAEPAVGSPVRVRERCRWHFYAIGLPYRCAGDDNSYPGKGAFGDGIAPFKRQWSR